MKTFVTAVYDYKDELAKDELYELVHEFETPLVKTGKALVINFEDSLMVYDSSFFRSALINK